VDKVKTFENDFLEFLELKHKKTLTALAQGKLTDEITSTLVNVAKEVIEKY
jgi:F-type H+-transporting ATPase subunit alpha